MRFHFAEPGVAMPPTTATLYVDGTAPAGALRPRADLELSHWVPNRSPAEWKADSSTEMCLRFAEKNPKTAFDLVVNNHADVDGVLSVFAIMHPEPAFAHRELLIGAAEMGDFWACPRKESRALCVALASWIARSQADGVNGEVTFRRGMEMVRAHLDGRFRPTGEVRAAFAAIDASIKALDDDEVVTSLLKPRLASFVIPRALADRDPWAVAAPPWGGVSHPATRLHPVARMRDHAEKILIVSAEVEGGWVHDLWYPSYAWAETPNRWRPPGLTPDPVHGYRLDHPKLAAAIDDFARQETGTGRWRLATSVSASGAFRGRASSVVASFVDDEEGPAVSRLSPETLVARFSTAFAHLV
jgi:uncharacterized protein DUF6687